MQTTCAMYAKIVKTSKKTVRVLYSFNNVNKITVTNCAYSTGDLATVDSDPQYIAQQISKANTFVKKAFSTNNIVMQ